MNERARQFSLAYLTVLGNPPRDVVEMAATVGYDFVSLRLTPVTPDEPTFPFLTDPGFVRDVVKGLNETGVALLDVELIRTDPGTSVTDFAPFVEVSAELGARHIIAQVPEVDRSRAIDTFGALCGLAAPYGLTVDLEFIPWSPTADLDDAADIVTKAAAPNGGVLVDTLHFSRSGSSVDQLSDLPRELFNFIQLCDAQPMMSESSEELIRVARSDRDVAGAGIIDLVPILNALPGVPYALEVPNDEMRRDLGALEYASHVLQETKRFFAAVDATAAAR
ncbi:MAG TPA: TIM barrel protein [Acidimicrobiia bacterium]|nr:TIM barrel protein [Acidimicrobiia bacterium]